MKRKKTNQVINTEMLNSIYKVRANHADRVYVTTLIKGKNTNIRLTFAENVPETNSEVPVNAVLMNVEDLQGLYNVLGTTLQNLRSLGRIE